MSGSLPEHVSNPDPLLYLGGNYVVVDFETTTKEKGSPVNPDNRIVLACWYNGPDHPNYTGEVRSERAGEYELATLVEDVEAADFVVAHNAKFEAGWLRRCGVDLYSLVVYDTMIAEYVIGGNRYNLRQLGLDACLERYGLAPKEGVVSKMIKAGVPTEYIPERWLLKYCVRDVEAAHELFCLTRVKLDEEGKLPIQYHRCLQTPCLAHIETRGMQLDVDEARRIYEEYETEYVKAEQELQEFCGGASPGSPVQMKEFVYGELNFSIPTDYYGRELLTDTGQPKLDANTVSQLKPKTKRQREFLEKYTRFTELKSAMTKYLNKFKDCADKAGGMLYGTFNQTNTKTHRLSSSGTEFKIQFQNMDRSLKPMFKARNKGWLIGEADGAQLEFRAAVHLGRDATGLYDIAHGVDIHSYTAAVITDAGQPTDRQGAKEHTFKPLYGGSSGTDAERAYYDAFKEKYAGIAATQQRWVYEVLERKSLRTEWGLDYYWPDCKMLKSGYVRHTTKICNYPVQAFATAEIIPLALVCCWHRLRSLAAETFLVNTVHDSLIAELPEHERELWHDVSKQSLIYDVYDILPRLYGIQLTVPLGAGVMIGSHWANKEAKASEVVYEAPESLWYEAAEAEGMVA